MVFGSFMELQIIPTQTSAATIHIVQMGHFAGTDSWKETQANLMLPIHSLTVLIFGMTLRWRSSIGATITSITLGQLF